MDPRPGWESYYLGIAHAVAARGECTRRQVGAVIVHHHSIIATGYNGAPPGWTSCLDGGCPRADSDATPGSGYADSKCVAIHANYWPEFAQAGKGGITLRHVLAHASGLYAVVWGSPDEHQTRYTGAKVVGTVG